MKRRAVSKLLFAWLFSSTALLADNRLANISLQNLDKNTFRVTIGDSELDVLIRDKVLLSKKDRLLDWVGYSAQAVHHYYGRFPVDKLLIKIQVTDGNRVRFGQAFGGHSPSVRVVVGRRTATRLDNGARNGTPGYGRYAAQSALGAGGPGNLC